MKTNIPSNKISPEDCLLNMESVIYFQDVSGSGSSSQWEPIETENGSRADLAMTDELELKGAPTGPQDN